ncbi:MAG: 2,3-cyclic phosphodiesterase [Gemmatimonadetes bacterium]|nr:2,3-cyclic phosphodiesterase [Gemmatimonadota bacterium]
MASASAGERLFLAIPLADDARRGLEAHLAGALGGDRLSGRPVPARNWHFTLRFLGDTSAADVARLREGMRSAVLGPAFDVELARLGAFRDPRRAAVVWMGVGAGVDEMRALAARVERVAVDTGFAPERKPFSPHLTLARVQPPADVRPLLARVPPFGGAMRVRQVVLFRSMLGSGPPRYEPVERFALA